MAPLPSPLVLGLAGLVLVASLLLRILPDLEAFFFLVPGSTITRPWQVLTCGYFEDAAVNLLIGVAALVGCAMLLRDSWGEEEFLRFVVLTNGLQGCATWVCMIVLYILFRSEHFLFVRAACPDLSLFPPPGRLLHPHAPASQPPHTCRRNLEASRACLRASRSP
jgi:hypothetical protein